MLQIRGFEGFEDKQGEEQTIKLVVEDEIMAYKVKPDPGNLNFMGTANDAP